jgi:hypothetical protein
MRAEDAGSEDERGAELPRSQFSPQNADRKSAERKNNSSSKKDLRSGAVSRKSRRRDLVKEQTERASFIVLQHLSSLASAGQEKVYPGRIAADLGFSREETEALVAYLIGCGYLGGGPGSNAELSLRGREYIERLAGRRHSVRT